MKGSRFPDGAIPSRVERLTPALYRWAWRTRLPGRYGQTCKLLARGAMNSCLLEFPDGYRVITSRSGLRRLSPGPLAPAQKDCRPAAD